MQTTADGTILRVNNLFCVWIGCNTDALVGQRRFQDLLTVGGRIFHQTHWAPLLRMQGSISEVKLELMHADGSLIPIVINAFQHERAGTTVHELAAFIARDRDKYERELLRLQADAKDRAIFAEQMIGIVSHDLRNPLSVIRMGATLLGGGELTPTQRRSLARITRATERAHHLIADLLDFTQARLGNGLSVSIASMDVHAVVAEALEELALAHPGPLTHERSGPGKCVADAHRLVQLIGNLVSNAFAYGLSGELVTVRSTVQDETVAIEVHNHGAPIPLEAQADIFQPMTRVGDGANVTRSVGLGLYIVSAIAKAHGGHALVTSSVEGGTTFTVVFPKQRSQG